MSRPLGYNPHPQMSEVVSVLRALNVLMTKRTPAQAGLEENLKLKLRKVLGSNGPTWEVVRENFRNPEEFDSIPKLRLIFEEASKRESGINPQWIEENRVPLFNGFMPEIRTFEEEEDAQKHFQTLRQNISAKTVEEEFRKNQSEKGTRTERAREVTKPVMEEVASKVHSISEEPNTGTGTLPKALPVFEENFEKDVVPEVRESPELFASNSPNIPIERIRPEERNSSETLKDRDEELGAEATLLLRGKIPLARGSSEMKLVDFESGPRNSIDTATEPPVKGKVANLTDELAGLVDLLKASLAVTSEGHAPPPQNDTQSRQRMPFYRLSHMTSCQTCIQCELTSRSGNFVKWYQLSDRNLNQPSHGNVGRSACFWR